MSVPGIVQSTLDGNEIAARVPLGGDDELFVTSSKTIVYRSDGLLSDESVEEYSHDADRLTLSEGRRKTTITLEYPLEGTREFTIPASKTDAVLHPLLAGVLNGNGITDPGETVVQTYRFSELTVLITSDRLVKHIGAAVWDEDFEEYHFEDVTNLTFEDGNVATQVVLTVGGRPQRIKAPNEQANDLRERLQRALFEYHDVESLAELNETLGTDDDLESGTDSASVDFGNGVDPLDADPPERDEAGEEGAVGNATAGAGSRGHDSRANGTAAEGSTGTSDPTDETHGSSRADSQPTRQVSDPDHDASATDATASTFDMSSDESTHSSADPEGRETAGEVTDDTGPRHGTDAGVDHDHTELRDRIESLEATVERQTEVVERQTEVIEHQRETIEQLITELRAGR